MASFKKINSYTWVLNDGKKTDQQLKKVLENYPAVKNNDFLKDTRETSENHQKNYEKFCKKIFENRKFISVLEFNRLISQHFNQNSTYYRKRMIALNLITVRNNVVYPA